MEKSHVVFALTVLVLSISAHAKTLTIRLDKSGSNPLMSDPHYAASAAEYTASLIEQLKEGDVVRLGSFGSRGEASNILDQTFVLSRRLRAKQLAASIAKYINSLPEHAAESQSSTNIVAFLEFDGELDCANGGTVLLLTDGVESSETVSGGEFLSGAKGLPAPNVSLTGCELIFHGLGVGLPASSVRFMRQEWDNHITAAGGKFTAVVK